MSNEIERLLAELDRRLEAGEPLYAPLITPEEDIKQFIEGFLDPPLTDEERAMMAAGLLDPDDKEIS